MSRSLSQSELDQIRAEALDTLTAHLASLPLGKTQLKDIIAGARDGFGAALAVLQQAGALTIEDSSDTSKLEKLGQAIVTAVAATRREQVLRMIDTIRGEVELPLAGSLVGDAAALRALGQDLANVAGRIGLELRVPS